jgi:hypothetical protein
MKQRISGVLLLFAVNAQARVVFSTVRTPFTQTIAVPTGSQTETVKLSGDVYSLVQVTIPGDPCISTDPCRSVPITVSSLGLATGVGSVTGASYEAVGTAQSQTTFTMPGAFPIATSLNLYRNFNPTPIIPPAPISPATILDVSSGGTATSAPTVPPGLVSWWKADGNAFDETGRNPGSLSTQESVTFVPGRSGQAFSFFNQGFVQVPDPSMLCATCVASLEPPNVTIIAWVQGIPQAPGSYILSKGAQGCDNSSYALRTGDGGRPEFSILDTTGVTVTGASGNASDVVWDSKWHMLAGTYNGIDAVLYLDGVEVAFGFRSTPFPINYQLQNPQLYIGAYRGGCENRFFGNIDDVSIFNRALSPAEIGSLFANTPAIPTARTAYTTFGPGFAFTPGTTAVYDRGPGIPGAAAASDFIPQTTVTLSRIDIALAKVLSSGPAPMEIQLRADSGGSPGSILRAWSVSDLPLVGPTHLVESLLASPVLTLTAGTRYWIAVVPGPNTEGRWDAGTAVTTGGKYAQSPNGGATWDTFSQASGSRLAFDVVGVP